jgi:PAS domain S-box-containing protein
MELNSAAKRITEGDWDQELPTHPVTEVDELADSFGTMTDNLQQTFATVQASEYRFRTLFENSRDMIFITDPEGKVLEINSAGLALFGYSRADIPQLNAQQWYVNPGDRPKVLAQIEQAGSVKDWEIQFRKQDGTIMDCLLTANERRAEDGRFLGYQGIIRDVTRQKKAEAERLQLAAIQRELLIAQKMQHGLLPPSRPVWPGLEVVCTSAPARTVGGDFYSYNPPLEGSNHGYGVAIGDVSGKGMSAALLMGTCLAQFDASAALGLSPSERMAHLDLAVKPYTEARGQNCAMCYSEFSPPVAGQPGSVTIVNAGCVAPYIKRRDGSVEWYEVTGFPLGIGLGAEHGYMSKTVPLEPGDLLVLASDGVVETMDENGHLLGFGRLETILRQAPVSSAEAMQFHLLEAVVDFAGERERADDMTIVVVRV